MILPFQKTDVKELDCVQSLIKAISQYYECNYYMIFHKVWAIRLELSYLNQNKSVIRLGYDETDMLQNFKQYHGISIELKPKAGANLEALIKREIDHKNPVFIQCYSKYLSWCQDISETRLHSFLIIGLSGNKLLVYDPYYLSDVIAADQGILDTIHTYGLVERQSGKERDYSQSFFLQSNIDFFKENNSMRNLEIFEENLGDILKRQCSPYYLDPNRSPLIRNLKLIYSTHYNLLTTLGSKQLICDVEATKIEKIADSLRQSLKLWERIRLILIKDCISKTFNSEPVLKYLLKLEEAYFNLLDTWEH